MLFVLNLLNGSAMGHVVIGMSAPYVSQGFDLFLVTSNAAYVSKSVLQFL